MLLQRCGSAEFSSGLGLRIRRWSKSPAQAVELFNPVRTKLHSFNGSTHLVRVLCSTSFKELIQDRQRRGQEPMQAGGFLFQELADGHPMQVRCLGRYMPRLNAGRQRAHKEVCIKTFRHALWGYPVCPRRQGKGFHGDAAFFCHLAHGCSNETASVLASVGGFRGGLGTLPSCSMCFQQVDAQLPIRGVDSVDSSSGESDHTSGKVHCRSTMLNKHLKPVLRVPNQDGADSQPRLRIFERILFWRAYMPHRRLLLYA